MKKFQWLSTLLVVSIGCLAVTNANADAKPTHEKRNHKAIPHRKLTVRDVAECTRLIDRVAKQDKMPIIPVQSFASSKAVTHSRTPAEIQLFAADNVPNSHLTAKPVALPVPASKITTVKPSVPLATLATQPTFKPTTATLVPASPVRHAIPNEVHGQITPTTTKVATPTQHVDVSTTPKKPDLNNLQGKSASLAEIEKAKSANKKSPPAAKKPTSDTTKKNLS